MFYAKFIVPCSRNVATPIIVFAVQADPDPPCPAREQRQDQDHPQAGQDHHHGAPPHLALAIRRLMDQVNGNYRNVILQFFIVIVKSFTVIKILRKE